MKKPFLLVLSLSLLFDFVGCGSDDGGDGDGGANDDGDAVDPVLFAALEGDWNAESKSLSGCTTSSQNGTYECGEGFVTCIALNFQVDDVFGGGYFFSDIESTDGFSGSITSGAVQDLTSSSFSLCEPNFLGDPEFLCNQVFSYSLSNGYQTMTVTWTDTNFPGCTSSATFTKVN
mgnify:CR=1 FL=1